MDTNYTNKKNDTNIQIHANDTNEFVLLVIISIFASINIH